jgi:hypothetical protein
MRHAKTTISFNGILDMVCIVVYAGLRGKFLYYT